MKNREKENEINACTAFIEILREIKNVEYIIACRPEESNGKSQDVDFILTPKSDDEQFPKIAVEHTIVEAHENQKYYVNILCGIEKEIQLKCQGKLPADHSFGLIVPPSLVVGISKKRGEQFVKEISNWILTIAETLHDRQSFSRSYIEGEVSLECIGSCEELNGTIGVLATSPEKEKKERQDRFRQAIEKKLPKLVKYKEEKLETALLLEDISFRQSNLQDGWKSLIPEQYLSDFHLKIDYVVIFVSNKKKMIIGNMWKEKSQLYSEVPHNRRFSFHHRRLEK